MRTGVQLSLITVNVGAPSVDRAQRQLRWLTHRPEHVLVLTETKATAGSQYLAQAFTAAGSGTRRLRARFGSEQGAELPGPPCREPGCIYWRPRCSSLESALRPSCSARPGAGETNPMPPPPEVVCALPVRGAEHAGV